MNVCGRSIMWQGEASKCSARDKGDKNGTGHTQKKAMMTKKEDKCISTNPEKSTQYRP